MPQLKKTQKKTHFDRISLIPNEPEKDRPRPTLNPHIYIYIYIYIFSQRIIHTEIANKKQQSIKIYYSMFI